MHRPLRASASMLLVVLVAVPAAASSSPSSDAFPRLRCLDERAKTVLDNSVRRSLTVRELMQRIEHSDLIVFLRVGVLPGEMAGATNLMTATVHTRYVIVTLDPRCPPTDLVARLGHELQHVVEIADEPRVRDVRSLRAHFDRIGWHSGTTDRWETKGALETGRRVAHEVRGEGAGRAWPRS